MIYCISRHFEHLAAFVYLQRPVFNLVHERLAIEGWEIVDCRWEILIEDNMPKVNKLISSHKCQRCRHDRQKVIIWSPWGSNADRHKLIATKCTPEKRHWSGTLESRCDRCKKYNYTCSANRTRAQEKNGLRDEVSVDVEETALDAATDIDNSQRYMIWRTLNEKRHDLIHIVYKNY